MASTEQIVGVYQELAEAYDRRGEAQMRDRFLVLAADAAFSGRRKDDAERLYIRPGAMIVSLALAVGATRRVASRTTAA